MASHNRERRLLRDVARGAEELKFDEPQTRGFDFNAHCGRTDTRQGIPSSCKTRVLLSSTHIRAHILVHMSVITHAHGRSTHTGGERTLVRPL